MRHKYNKDNKKHKQERSQSDDVDESELVDQMPGRTVSDGGAHGRKDNAGSALTHSRGSALGHHKEDKVKEDEAGSAPTVKQLRHKLGLSSKYIGSVQSMNIDAIRCSVRSVLYSHLDQRATRTSLLLSD